MREELRRLGHRVSIFTAAAGRAGSRRPRRPGIAAGQRVGSWLRGRDGFAERHILGWGRRLAATVLRVHRRTPIDVFEMEESFGWMADVQAMTSIPTVVKLHGPAFLSLVEEELDTPFARAQDRARRARAHAHGVRDVAGAAHAWTRRSRATASSRRSHATSTIPFRCPRLHRSGRWTAAIASAFSSSAASTSAREAIWSCAPSTPWRGTTPSLQLTFVGPDGGVVDSHGRRLGFDDARASLCPGRPGRESITGADSIRRRSIRCRASAYLTIVASRWENQSYTALEAMAQGCPLVSSDAGGQGEFVVDGSTGLAREGRQRR